MLRKPIAVIFSLILLLPQICLAQEMPFKDVSATYPYVDGINYLKDRGIITGYADGTFRPTNYINRAEYTKIVMRVKHGDVFTFPEGENCFNDVKKDDWFSPYVCLAKAEGVVDGYSDGTFAPAGNINVAEALKITIDAWGFNLSDPNQIWYQPYVDYAIKKNLYLFTWKDFDQKVTRAELAQLEFLIKELVVNALTDTYMETYKTN